MEIRFVVNIRYPFCYRFNIRGMAEVLEPQSEQMPWWTVTGNTTRISSSEVLCEEGKSEGKS
jgi:hypothetical protein